MNYARLVDGRIEIGLPQSGFLKDGRSVSGYNLLDEETLRSEGWKPLIEDIPEHNPETQYIQFAEYIDEIENYKTRYNVIDKQVITQQPQDYPVNQELVDAYEAIAMLFEMVEQLKEGAK